MSYRCRFVSRYKPHGDKPKAAANPSQKLQQETKLMEKRKKRNQKPEQREEIKAAEERKKEKKDFNVNIANVGFEDRVISFNERS